MQRESAPKTAKASKELVVQVDSEKTQKEKRLADLRAKLDYMLDKQAYLEYRLGEQYISEREFKRMLRD